MAKAQGGASKTGRPPLYPDTEEERQELCDRVIALGSEGKSEVQISAAIEVPRTTMRSWAEQHEAFSSALTRAKELEQVWWETQAQNNLTNKEFNANLWNKSMSARFKSDYGDKLSVSGDKDGSPLQVVISKEDAEL